jgi:hypothetical protein
MRLEGDPSWPPPPRASPNVGYQLVDPADRRFFTWNLRLLGRGFASCQCDRVDNRWMGPVDSLRPPSYWSNRVDLVDVVDLPALTDFAGADSIGSVRARLEPALRRLVSR